MVEHSHSIDPALEQHGHEAIQAAGRMLRERLRPTEVHAKAPFDLVTDVDTAVESCVREHLADGPGDHQFIGEESFDAGATPRLDRLCWVLDPVDGTVNYAFGLPFYSISLALLHEGEPVLGWVLDPLRDELFFARRGERPTLNGRPLIPPARHSGLPVAISTGLLSEWAGRADAGAVLGGFLERYGKVRVLGSQALHLCYVAAGRLCAAINLESKLWDDAAGALIVNAAGGRYTDVVGNSLFPVDSRSPLLRGEPTRSLAGDAETHADLLRRLVPGG